MCKSNSLSLPKGVYYHLPDMYSKQTILSHGGCGDVRRKSVITCLYQSPLQDIFLLMSMCSLFFRLLNLAGLKPLHFVLVSHGGHIKSLHSFVESINLAIRTQCLRKLELHLIRQTEPVKFSPLIEI